MRLKMCNGHEIMNTFLSKKTYYLSIARTFTSNKTGRLPYFIGSFTLLCQFLSMVEKLVRCSFMWVGC